MCLRAVSHRVENLLAFPVVIIPGHQSLVKHLLEGFQPRHRIGAMEAPGLLIVFILCNQTLIEQLLECFQPRLGAGKRSRRGGSRSAGRHEAGFLQSALGPLPQIGVLPRHRWEPAPLLTITFPVSICSTLSFVPAAILALPATRPPIVIGKSIATVSATSWGQSSLCSGSNASVPISSAGSRGRGAVAAPVCATPRTERTANASRIPMPDFRLSLVIMPRVAFYMEFRISFIFWS